MFGQKEISLMNSANAENLNIASAPSGVNRSTLVKGLQFSSSLFAVAGGTLLASNTDVSKYGFILLAFSSGQMLGTSILTKDRSLMVYAASVFCFVDCLGVYRWLLQ